MCAVVQESALHERKYFPGRAKSPINRFCRKPATAIDPPCNRCYARLIGSCSDKRGQGVGYRIEWKIIDGPDRWGHIQDTVGGIKGKGIITGHGSRALVTDLGAVNCNRISFIDC